MIKFNSDLIVVFAILTTSFFFLYMTVVFIPNAYATAADADNYSLIRMTEQRTFRDSNGNLNVIGVVDNNGQIPVGITVGLNTTSRYGSTAGSNNHPTTNLW